MGSKHTPGPWEAEPEMEGDGTPIHGCWQVTGTAGDGDPVCTYASEADARLIAAAPDLLEALEAVHDWRGLCDSNANETFERIGEMFHRDTGMLRPGKDQPMACGESPSDQERSNAFKEWAARKNDELNAAIRAAIAKARGGA